LQGICASTKTSTIGYYLQFTEYGKISTRSKAKIFLAFEKLLSNQKEKKRKFDQIRGRSKKGKTANPEGPAKLDPDNREIPKNLSGFLRKWQGGKVAIAV